MTKRVYKGPSEHNNVLSYSGWAKLRRRNGTVAIETTHKKSVSFHNDVWYLYRELYVFIPGSFDDARKATLRNGCDFVTIDMDDFEELFITKGPCDH